MSRDIIKLDQIDVTFHQKKRTITAVKDVTIHIQEGDIYGILDILEQGNQPLYG
ncbi:ABC transporter ATP-binding protein [Streptococcus pneumoniae]|nr:ABC transporter ATP-binding protein [Streptococcus pneumoniae]